MVTATEVFRLTVTVVKVLPARVPLSAELLSQAAWVVSDQVSAVVPELVKRNVCETGLIGPPAEAVAEKPLPGVITRGSAGAARALMRLLPVGDPQPVHRSYPG